MPLNGKGFRKREKKIMRDLGAKPQPLSGAGWIRKEDGEDEHFLYQLKSTQADSRAIKLAELEELFRHALGAGKIPVFVLDFVPQDLQLLCFRASDMEKIKKILKGEETETSEITLQDLTNVLLNQNEL